MPDYFLIEIITQNGDYFLIGFVDLAAEVTADLLLISFTRINKYDVQHFFKVGPRKVKPWNNC